MKQARLDNMNGFHPFQVGIGQQAQAQFNSLAFRVLTQVCRIQGGRGVAHTPVLANHSLEEKAEDL